MFTKIAKAINRVLEYVIAILLIALVCLMFTHVVLRQVFQTGLRWSEEACRYLFCWTVFLGIACAVHEKSHMALTYLEDKFESLGRYIKILSQALMIIFFGVLLYYGWSYSASNMDITASATGLPMGFVYSIMPTSAALSIFFIIHQVYQDFISARTNGKGTVTK